jgi:hypothetical protein
MPCSRWPLSGRSGTNNAQSAGMGRYSTSEYSIRNRRARLTRQPILLAIAVGQRGWPAWPTGGEEQPKGTYYP